MAAIVTGTSPPIDRDVSSPTPKPPPRFTGNAPTQAQAVALWRYIRIMKAINAFEDGSCLKLRVMSRVRWSVGIHREMIRLRDALGNLIMQGCTGGTFLSCEVSSLNQWIDFEGPFMLVDFNRAPINRSDPLPQWYEGYEFFLSRDELEMNEWWCWNDFLPPPHATRPPWWGVTNMEDAKMFMPTLAASRVFINKVMQSVAEAQIFCENNRNVIETIHGPPPGPSGFQSFPRVEHPYDRR